MAAVPNPYPLPVSEPASVGCLAFFARRLHTLKDSGRGLGFESPRAYHFLFLGMAFVYILQSETTGRFSIGSTDDLER